MRAGDEIPKRVSTNAREADENARIADVVLLQVVRLRVVGNERVAVGDIHSYHQRVRSADLCDAMHANILPRTFSVG